MKKEMGQGTTTDSRRKFLKIAGKFALYTPPALMVMTQASTVSFANSVKVHCDNGGGNGGEGCDASQQENSNKDET
jgi:hypothetical protein